MTGVADYVKQFSAFTEEQCDYILDCITQQKYISKFQPSQTGFGVTNVRTSYTSDVKLHTDLDTLLYKAVNKSYHTWLSLLDNRMANVFCGYYPDVSDQGYSINRYTETQYYNYHVDLIKKNNIDRILSLCFYINDDYCGGELEFPFATYKPKKGDAIVFPSTWLYPHRSTPVTAGTKYSIVTWFVDNVNKDTESL